MRRPYAADRPIPQSTAPLPAQRSGPISRRRVLAGAAVTGAVLLAGCGGGDKPGTDASGRTTGSGSSGTWNASGSSTVRGTNGSGTGSGTASGTASATGSGTSSATGSTSTASRSPQAGVELPALTAAGVAQLRGAADRLASAARTTTADAAKWPNARLRPYALALSTCLKTLRATDPRLASAGTASGQPDTAGAAGMARTTAAKRAREESDWFRTQAAHPASEPQAARLLARVAAGQAQFAKALA